MNRVLIDLTDLELWGGQHGGTQRVVYGIAKNFYSQQQSLGQEIVFITFSARKKTFFRTDFAPIYQRVESQKSHAKAEAVTQTVSLKRRIKQNASPYVPESLRRNEAARHVVVKSLKVAGRVARAARVEPLRQKIAKTRLSERIHFQKDDTVLMLGKPWDNLDIQKTLSADKQRVGFKLVQVVYDLIICLQPQLHHTDLFTHYTQHMFEAVSASDMLLPISESSARDLREFCKRLNLPTPAINVIRLGDEMVDNAATAKKPDARIKDTFIACVGTVEIRKNHILLYYAYKLGLEKGLDLPQLVIVGTRGWLADDLQYLVKNDPSVKDKIIILNKINDAGLNWIYKNCLFTVYPSMYEGWGLPVAESLAYGKLCIASNSSSIPEIAGNLIDYFSPYDAGQLLEVIIKYLDPKTLHEKEAALLNSYKPTTWGKTFKQVLHFIE